MAANACIESVQKAALDAGRELTTEELTQIFEDFDNRVLALRSADDMLSNEAAALRAADELGNEVKLAAVIERRNAALNARRRAEAIGYIRNTWSDRYDLGLESFLVGTNVARAGARRSVAAEQKQLSHGYIAGFINDIDQAGLTRTLARGDQDTDIADALWRLGMDRPLDGLSDDAVAIARIMQRYQDATRVDANRAGAFIRKLPGYIVRQSHDPYKITRAGFTQWRDEILPLLDERTFAGVTDRDAMLLETYNGLSSGVHLKAATSEPTGFKGPRNLAKKVSQERVLHFRDGVSWDQYNSVYGTGSLRESFLGGLQGMGDSTGLMRRLGTNPEANWKMMLDDLQQDFRNDPEALRRFQIDRNGMLAKRFAEVDGTTRMAVNNIGARVASNIRAWQSMSKLGGALLSSFADLVNNATELRYQGVGNVFTNMGRSMGDAISGGRRTAEQKEILAGMGVFFDNARGEVVSRFSANDTLGGKMSRAQRLFFKLNGLTWWTDTMRSSAAMAMSHNLAANRTSGWPQLNPDTRRVLEMFEFDEGRWDMIRTTATREADGREYMTTQSVDDIPREQIESYLTRQGRTVNDAAVNELREEIRGQLRTYITDRASYAAIEPDARTRSMMQWGTRPGTYEGELIRFIGQFKSFPVAILQKTMGRELYGRGYTPAKYGSSFMPGRELIKALSNGNGEKQGVAQLMLWMTLFGYGSMAAKDMVKGREPRPVDDPKTWAAAMMQGGALGIYADFLFGEANRFGGGMIASLAGPTAGEAEAVIGILQRIRDGDDVASTAFRVGLRNTPFMNLFYTRQAMDYLFLYSVQEAMNPGSLRRMERRVSSENNQEFLLSPSRDHLDPFGISR